MTKFITYSVIFAMACCHFWATFISSPNDRKRRKRKK